MVISSYVIDTIPEKQSEVASELTLLEAEGVEIHGQDKVNKIVITIESESIDSTYALATKITNIKGVLNTNLVFCNFEDEVL